MSLTVNDLAVIYPEQLFLEFTPKEQELAWQQVNQKSEKINTNKTKIDPQSNKGIAARWHAYLNYLCLQTFLQYLNSEQEFNYIPIVWKQADLPNFWQIVTGTAIELGKTRFILIPDAEKTYNELRVPREWVDIPSWAGNYYLAVEINLEQCWLRVCGYATHQQLQTEGKYDSIDETYSLQVEELNEDLTVLWTMIEFDFDRQQQLPTNPPSLSARDAVTLLTKLANCDRSWLRLHLPFAEWEALITNERWLQEIYYQHNLMDSSQLITPTINLSQWLQGIFTLGWQPLNTLINSETSNLAYALRSFSTNQPSAVEGVKLLDLGMQLGNRAVALLIGMTAEIDNKIGIRVQLHPARDESHLPTNIKLALLTKSGEVLQEFQARSQDELIQLKRFTCPRKKQFLIRVTLNSYSITEEFAID